MLWPMIALSNIAQGSAVLAMIVLQKGDEDAEQVNIPACISCYLGVTEPAIFGVNLKYVFPFVCAMIGSAIAGFLSCAFSCTANAIGVGGLPGILAMQPKSMLPYALCMLVAIVVPFILTFIVGKRQGIDKQAQAVAAAAADNAIAPAAAHVDAIDAPGTLAAVADGYAKAMSDAPDAVFASLAMGDGVVIEPAEGAIYSPVSGSVTMVFDTKHALGLVANDGTEILIHIGVDTVELGGKPFTAHVKAGDAVKAGDLLMEVDLAAVKAAGKDTATMVVVTNSDAFSSIKAKTGEVKAGETSCTLTK